MTKWLAVARAELGITEKGGRATNPRIVEYFLVAGHGEVKDDETYWCAVFVNFCLERADQRGTMSMAARSYMRWGKQCEPKPGAIAIFPRGTSSWQGHVTFVERVEGDHVLCIGGNQDNSVKRSRYKIADALDFRWPSTLRGSRTVKASVAGSLSAGGNVVLEQMQEATYLSQTLQDYVSWAAYTAIGLAIACFVLGGYFKWQDIKEKG